MPSELALPASRQPKRERLFTIVSCQMTKLWIQSHSLLTSLLLFTLQPPMTKPSEFSEEAIEMLSAIDVYLFHDQKMFCQLCKLVRHTIKYNLYHLKHNPQLASKEKLEAVSHVKMLFCIIMIISVMLLEFWWITMAVQLLYLLLILQKLWE